MLTRARNDIKNIVEKGRFQEDIILTHPSGAPVVNITGIHTKHWIQYDGEGNQYNGKNAHITISEKTLVDLGYPTRNQKTGNIDLKNHKVSVKDSSNVVKKYVITQVNPTETFGLIICILGDSKD